MSEFHGGFFVRSSDPEIQERIRQALATALPERGYDPSGHRVTFAARARSPVMHVAVRGGVADGKGYASFHLENEELGACVARAARSAVWAYSYENQSGSESVARFEPDGTRGPAEHASWDELADDLGIDADDADSVEELWAALPLGKLARELGVARGLLDMTLAYDTRVLSLPLVGEASASALREYLRGPLAPMPEVATPEATVMQKLYFPESMLADARALAGRLDVTFGTVMWAAWEAARAEIAAMPPEIAEPDAEMPAPPDPRPEAFPAELLVPEHADPIAALPEPDGKAALSVALPERVLEELRICAVRFDRSLSWCMQRAYELARPRLHAARRK